MNKINIGVIVLWIASGGCVAATAAAQAGGEPRTVDKRVVISASGTAGGEAHEARTPVTFLGVAVAPADPALAAQLRLPEGQGLVVKVVEPESPAAKAGLQEHDLLTKLDDQILIDPRQLFVLVRNRKEGEKVTLTYMRAGAEARAPVTLATHTPEAGRAFHWIGREPAGVLFHHEQFRAGRPAEIRDLGPAHVMPFELSAPGPGHRPVPVGPHGDRVMIYRPEAGVVFSDEEGTLELQVDEKGRTITARNPNGDVVFTGSVSTPEERAALPDDLRKRLEKLEGLDVFEMPMPAMGATRIVPDEPVEPIL
jgi:serine protease Do